MTMEEWTTNVQTIRELINESRNEFPFVEDTLDKATTLVKEMLQAINTSTPDALEAANYLLELLLNVEQMQQIARETRNLP